MCLAVPGEVVEWIDRDPLFAKAVIDFGNVLKTCHMACVPDANVGDFVIVHAGIAIAIIDREQAEMVLAELQDAESQDGSHEVSG